MNGGAAKVGVLLAASAIVLVTLAPSYARPTVSTATLSVSLSFVFADALRNVVLFAPLGAALAWARFPLGGALLVGVGLSGFVELLQLFIPGRFASPLDIVSNALGTATGIFLVGTHRAWLFPPDSRRRVLCAGAAIGAVAGALTPTILFAPAVNDGRVFGLWSPSRFMGLFGHDGRVVGASIDGLDLPRGAIADPARFWELRAGNHTLQIDAVAGRPPPGQAALLGVYGEDQQELLLVGPDREDLVYRFRTRGRRLGLETGQVRLRDGLRGIPPGATLRVRIEHVRPDICAELNGMRECGHGFTVGDGWMLITPDLRLDPAARRLVGACWLALLFLPLGYWMVGLAPAIGACVASGLGLRFAPSALGLLDTPIPQLVAPALGISLGILARWSTSRLASRTPGIDTHARGELGRDRT